MKQTNLIAFGFKTKSFLKEKKEELNRSGIHTTYIDDSGDREKIFLNLFNALDGKEDMYILLAHLGSEDIECYLNDFRLHVFLAGKKPPFQKYNVNYIFISPFEFEGFNIYKITQDILYVFQNDHVVYIDCEYGLKKNPQITLLDFFNMLYDDIFDTIKDLAIE